MHASASARSPLWLRLRLRPLLRAGDFAASAQSTATAAARATSPLELAEAVVSAAPSSTSTTAAHSIPSPLEAIIDDDSGRSSRKRPPTEQKTAKDNQESEKANKFKRAKLNAQPQRDGQSPVTSAAHR